MKGCNECQHLVSGRTCARHQVEVDARLTRSCAWFERRPLLPHLRLARLRDAARRAGLCLHCGRELGYHGDDTTDTCASCGAQDLDPWDLVEGL